VVALSRASSCDASASNSVGYALHHRTFHAHLFEDLVESLTRSDSTLVDILPSRCRRRRNHPILEKVYYAVLAFRYVWMPTLGAMAEKS